MKGDTSMVTKNKTGEKRGQVKVGKLPPNPAAVKDLTAAEAKKIKGGLIALQHEQTNLAHEQTKSARPGPGCGFACTSNHNEPIVRDAAPMQ
jgi:hypothetical protein